MYNAIDVSIIIIATTLRYIYLTNTLSYGINIRIATTTNGIIRCTVFVCSSTFCSHDVHSFLLDIDADAPLPDRHLQINGKATYTSNAGQSLPFIHSIQYLIDLLQILSLVLIPMV